MLSVSSILVPLLINQEKNKALQKRLRKADGEDNASSTN